MDAVIERCCGLDVHKKVVVACVMTGEGHQLRSFGTTTDELLAMAEWLTTNAVTHVAMESTGVYWQPVYNLLEGMGLTLLVVNAQHIKAVPGRKTDMKDATWIADLLRHGLLKGSYIPNREQRELRELTRYRRNLIEERATTVNRIQKTLEGANIKISSVLSDVTGVSGRAMLHALVDGEASPSEMAHLAKGRLTPHHAELEAALNGLAGPHQRLMLASHLRQIEFLETEISGLSEEIQRRLRPFEATTQRVQTIPGVGKRLSEVLIAEIGTDVSAFPSAAHLASWAKICPGTKESAGKRLSGRTGHGNRWLRSALVEAGWAAARTRNTYLAAQYRRIAARRGGKRAALAVGHTILTIAYMLMSQEVDYAELGGNYFDERSREATLRRSVRRIERLGYKVKLEGAV